ncbi:DUF2939 domain-containing protein [Variovorax sp. J22P271]|uniref:DUF2939 domain-containing protein n=1 Tax=Variovorax davisae TaxID=3053515 RepID=UPI00257819A1|nr:DUF2939 domain-containing protein [Variovorax sp. J22P271]MDM0035422.1 DUF2939 domain-containing protein [Variovorax sp. J22P271]
MKKSQRLAAAGLALLLLLAGAGYWYLSPFLAVRQLQDAAQRGDADTFNAHIDYPRLRESLKAQLTALLAQKLGAPKDGGSPLAALGNVIGSSLVNPLVDSMVRPETVMAAMQNGRLGRSAPEPAPPAPGSAPADSAAPQPKKARWHIERQGASRITAYAVDPARPDEPDSERLGLVFERSGFADWKLTDLRLPASAFRK